MGLKKQGYTPKRRNSDTRKLEKHIVLLSKT